MEYYRKHQGSGFHLRMLICLQMWLECCYGFLFSPFSSFFSPLYFLSWENVQVKALLVIVQDHPFYLNLSALYLHYVKLFKECSKDSQTIEVILVNLWFPSDYVQPFKIRTVVFSLFNPELDLLEKSCYQTLLMVTVGHVQIGNIKLYFPFGLSNIHSSVSLQFDIFTQTLGLVILRD